MGGTIRCLMVAIIVVAANYQSAIAQSTGASSAYSLTGAPSFDRDWSRQSDQSPMIAPSLPSHDGQSDPQRDERARVLKPQGYDIPDSLKEGTGTAGQSFFDQAEPAGGAMMRRQGSEGQAGGGMVVPGFTGVNPQRATPRPGGPSTDPTTGRDRTWAPNTGAGPVMPSTDPTQSDNRNTTLLMQQQQQRAAGNRSGFGAPPTGIDLPQQQLESSRQSSFDPSVFNRTNNQTNNQSQPTLPQQTLAQQRLGAPALKDTPSYTPLAELTQRDVINLGEWFGISATDPRLRDQNYVQDIYQRFIKADQAGLIDPTNPATRSVMQLMASSLQNQPPQDPRTQNQTQTPQRQDPLGQTRQPWGTAGSGGLLGNSGSSNNPNNGGFNLPQQNGFQNNLQNSGQRAAADPRFASLNGPVTSASDQNTWGTGTQLNASGQAPLSFNPANTSNQRSQYDPKLTREEIARLPPNGYTYDEYGLPLDRKGQMLDADGYVMDAQRARKLTLARMEQMAKEKAEAERLKDEELVERLAQRAGLTGNNRQGLGYPNNQGLPNLPGFPNPSINGGASGNGMYAAGNPNGVNGQLPANSVSGQRQPAPKTFESETTRNRPEIDPADLAMGVGKASLKKSNPYVNVFLLFSLVSNCFLFVWLHRLWQHHRDLIAQNRMATGGVSVE